MVGNFAQIYSPYLYNSDTGPRYLPAMIANTVFVFVSVLCATILRFCLTKENKKLDAMEAENIIQAEEIKERKEIVQASPGGLLALSSGFRYTL